MLGKWQPKAKSSRTVSKYKNQQNSMDLKVSRVQLKQAEADFKINNVFEGSEVQCFCGENKIKAKY